MRRFLSKKTAWTLVFLLTFFWSGIYEIQAYSMAKKELSISERRQLAESFESLFDAVDEALGELPRDSFDSKVVVEQVGKDYKRLLAWVSDNTCLIPYQGTLRGPVGVLMDKLGNSLDRSLLLAAMLRDAGYEVRLANARLPRKSAEEILKNGPQTNKFLEDSSREPDISLESLVQRYSDDHGLRAEGFREALKRSEISFRKLSEKASRLIDQNMNMIANSNVIPSDTSALSRRERLDAIAALSDHWWIQIKDQDSWMDLDPAFPESEPGRCFVPAAKTLNPDELDKRLFHTLRLKVIVERVEEGRILKNSVLEYTFRPSEHPGETLALFNYPVDWPQDFELFEPESNPRLINALAEHKEWQPVLMIGSQVVTASRFLDSGQVNRSKNTGKKSASIGGLSNGLFGGSSSKKSDTPSFLTAQWIEFQILAPGEKQVTFRREIYDRLGPAARSNKTVPMNEFTDAERIDRALALLGRMDILPLAGSLTPEFIAFSFMKDILSMRGLVSNLRNEKDSQWFQKAKGKVSGVLMEPFLLYNLAGARNAWERSKDTFYLDRINVLNHYAKFLKTDQDVMRVKKGFDIAHNPVAYPENTQDLFHARLTQGVVDTVAEALLLDENADNVENTALMFSGASNREIRFLSFSRGQEQDLLQLDLPPDVTHRISENMKAGQVVLVPAVPIRLDDKPRMGWWAIDKDKGHTIGVMDTGLHQAGSEKSLMDMEVKELLAFVRAYLGFATPGDLAVVSLVAKLEAQKVVWGMLGLLAGIAATLLAQELFGSSNDGEPREHLGGTIHPAPIPFDKR